MESKDKSLNASLRDAVAEMQEAPVVNIKGKEYATVVTRMEIFRKHFGLDLGITTDAIPSGDDQYVARVRAQIVAPNGHVLASGLAQEDMRHNKINYTSALEVAETSAIGRALAAFGLLGGEYASYNEMDEAIRTDPPEDKAASKHAVDRVVPERAPSVRASNERPSVTQYDFYMPKSAQASEIDKVFAAIDAIDNLDELIAYYNEFDRLMLEHMPEPEAQEIVDTFKARNKQLKGMNNAR